MIKPLAEVVKGSVKGLGGGACLMAIVAAPGAAGLYESIETKTGKISYGISAALLVASALKTFYTFADSVI